MSAVASVTSSVTQDSDYWCHTQFHSKKTTFAWTIGDFSVCMKVGKKLDSSTFQVSAANVESTWQLEFYPNGFRNSKHLILCAKHDEKLSHLGCQCDLFILDRNGTRLNVNGFSEMAKFNTYYYGEINRRLFSSQDVPNDKLTIRCEVTIFYESGRLSGDNRRFDFRADSNPVDNLSNDMRALFTSKSLSDVTIEVNGKEFLAHKLVLSARSTVFAAMFQCKMKESQENRVKIDDLTPEAFKILLEFIYTGKTANLKTIQQFEMVYYAANKYALDDLKKMCEIELSKKINVKNASKLLILAEMHDGKFLKDRVMNFFVTHYTEVMENDG